MSGTLIGTTLKNTVLVGTVSLPAGVVDNASVKAGANIDAGKVVHRFPVRLSQAGGAAVADETTMVHIFSGTSGTIESVEVAIETAAVGDSTVDVDVLIGGAGGAFASVLSAAVKIDNTIAVRTPIAGMVNTSAAAVGDIVQIDIDATAGTGTLPQGIVVTVVLTETPA